ncbi:hypothetical protein, partial [Cronobacter dublinensis]|uniref:hypothetical protein n=1 Tax=Cronobacter dublinensis TaxID=413497 RepID=UPI001F2CC094
GTPPFAPALFRNNHRNPSWTVTPALMKVEEKRYCFPGPRPGKPQSPGEARAFPEMGGVSCGAMPLIDSAATPCMAKTARRG